MNKSRQIFSQQVPFGSLAVDRWLSLYQSLILELLLMASLFNLLASKGKGCLLSRGGGFSTQAEI